MAKSVNIGKLVEKAMKEIAKKGITIKIKGSEIYNRDSIRITYNGSAVYAYDNGKPVFTTMVLPKNGELADTAYVLQKALTYIYEHRPEKISSK